MKILSVDWWVPIARLTFGVYLIHFQFIRMLYDAIDEPYSYTDATGAAFATFAWTCSLMCSLIVFVIVEKPMANLLAKWLAPPRIERASDVAVTDDRSTSGGIGGGS